MNLKQATDFEVRCTGTYRICSDGKFSNNYGVMKSYPYSKEHNKNDGFS